MISENEELLKRWLRFFIGLLILTGIFAFFSSGYSPPGVFGEVLRHNRACSIDASPLFYSEVENMAELEKGVRELRIKKREQIEKLNFKKAGVQNFEPLP
ncbi:MAG: hypothetical protein JSU85_06730 [Candidatus Zixiibacteriota bacterium]|nr:MAG: hypothetical protein JSU85_06730 [candidate division Zixibacteria bacterium]